MQTLDLAFKSAPLELFVSIKDNFILPSAGNIPDSSLSLTFYL